MDTYWTLALLYVYVYTVAVVESYRFVLQREKRCLILFALRLFHFLLFYFTSHHEIYKYVYISIYLSTYLTGYLCVYEKYSSIHTRMGIIEHQV